MYRSSEECERSAILSASNGEGGGVGHGGRGGPGGGLGLGGMPELGRPGACNWTKMVNTFSSETQWSR